MENSLELLTTAEAAKLIRRSPQTLRCWAMRDNGPIRPVRTFPRAPLLWPLEEIERWLKGEADQG